MPICEDTFRKTYIRFVERICNESDTVMQNFLGIRSEKYRLFSESEESNFSDNKKRITRVKPVTIKQELYYIATNLNICEYFNNIAKVLTPDLKRIWHIRLLTNDSWSSISSISKEESKSLVDPYRMEYTVQIDESGVSRKNVRKKKKMPVHIDYLQLNKRKAEIGDLGEFIVMGYERTRLIDAGCADLVDKIRRISIEDDSAGYDILSFSEDGSELYIEVKSTVQDYDCGFYISLNEISVANSMFSQGKQYVVYRVYNINESEGTAVIKQYAPPFDDDSYDMHPMTWYVGSSKK